MRHIFIPILSLFSLVLCSCSGYQLGNSKPSKLAHIKTITVPLVDNETQEVKLAAQTTNALVSTLSQDGSYRIVRKHEADATLHAVVKKIKFTEFRSNRLDTLRAEELNMIVHIDWQLVDNSGKVQSELYKLEGEAAAERLEKERKIILNIKKITEESIEAAKAWKEKFKK